MLAFFGLSSVAQASPIAEIICAPTSEMVQRLSKTYGSARNAQGIRGPETVMEVWTDDRGEWAMVVRYASGKSCIVAFGEHWQTFVQQPDAS